MMHFLVKRHRILLNLDILWNIYEIPDEFFWYFRHFLEDLVAMKPKKRAIILLFQMRRYVSVSKLFVFANAKCYWLNLEGGGGGVVLI